MARDLPRCVDTVVIGNGPAALILSYILHGHVPCYLGGHHDPILDSKLANEPNLLNLTPDLYSHFLSSLRYSTQALPVNTLLDTLLRPNADTELNPTSCIEWRHEPERAVSHVVIGNTPQAGGQWAENPVSASADIGTLSYAEQLSLPGYSYADHLKRTKALEQCDFVRPSRNEVADYLRAYPEAVGIADAVFTGIQVDQVSRSRSGFVIGSLGLHCKHLVLASGIFTVNIPPTPLLAPIAQLDAQEDPLLVIGSGFSAADVIISTRPTRRIIHIYQWAPESRPSPLRGCHHSAYPEYATVYRQMKLSAVSSSKKSSARSPLLRRKSNPFFSQRDWASLYEGLPNGEVVAVSCPDNTGSATVTIRRASGEYITRSVGGLSYVVGRRGTLDYLSPSLRSEVLGTSNGQSTDPKSHSLISGRTLRPKSEASLEVTKDVFIIGSLAGDSLIRHAVGGCVFAAGRITNHIPSLYSTSLQSSLQSSPSLSARSSSPSPIPVSVSCDDQDTNGAIPSPTPCSSSASLAALANGHVDLHLDRRKLARAVEVAHAENAYWAASGWWAGGLGYRIAEAKEGRSCK
ncbi:hypothetical protein K491DRAFT_707650 [Lophiostoma macrostomum CBS 122681]|uniref:FAD/NAD(P)-binding domain-containing protein n=1 Tax=Lophiostoma macrostomum CBS 122681 TaxID=1314788 RepID=A0A6A6SUQ7_9PLEO|nr:hypothetical protein K491DRAFT_707650 [Lophiostoma macrostomum CBS 122681]